MKTCTRCGAEKPLSEFWRNKNSHDGRMIYCRGCERIRFAVYLQNNSHKVAAAKARWQKANPEKVRVADRKSRLKNRKAWRLKNSEKISAQRRSLRNNNPAAKAKQAKALALWQKNNPERCAAHAMARFAAQRRAIPAWANSDAIAAVYAEAARLRRETGERYEVDHIVPLQGKTVSGLHWEGNLQILVKAANIAKHNRCWPDQP